MSDANVDDGDRIHRARTLLEAVDRESYGDETAERLESALDALREAADEVADARTPTEPDRGDADEPLFRKKPVTIAARRSTSREEIETLEGYQDVDPGDWIVTGVEGERYPCDDEVFRETYAPVNDRAREELDVDP